MRLALTLFAVGVALMFVFDATLTRIAGVALLFVGMALGVFAIASAEFIGEEEPHRRRP
jgi:phage shock protein PspC (stress-responsive transcriptional regulator)